MGTKVNPADIESESVALKKLIDNLWKGNYAEFARHCDLPGGKSMLSQHIKGSRPISLECAIAYAVGLGRTLADISPRLDSLISKLPPKHITAYAKTPPSDSLIASEPDLPVIPFPRADSAIVSEITDIARRIDDIGKGMLLLAARNIAKERAGNGKENTLISST